MNTEKIAIPSGMPGSTFQLIVHRFGRAGARPAIYIQASLHADEIPGMICALDVQKRLQALEAAGAMLGEVILVPFANPIGLAQEALGMPMGRFDLADGGNFNRGFPAFGAPLAKALEGKLGLDEARNVALIRATLVDLLEQSPAMSAAEHLKKTLMGLALPCDLVLDLHCDAEASLHLYTHPASETTFSPLAARLGCLAFLVEANSGGDPFDEALSRPWFELAQQYPDLPIPFACQSTTLELRGQRDVAIPLAQKDATALIGFLHDVGILAGGAGPAPAPLCKATPLAATIPLVAPYAGILSFHSEVGQIIAEGEPIATIIEPETGQSRAIFSPCSGVFFARSALRFVKAGKRFGKVAGTISRRSGNLLSP